MKKFTLKFLFFIALPTLYILSNLALNKYIASKQKLIIEEKRIFIFGDSHPKDAINPKYLKESVNYSQSAESYVFTYHKAKKFIKIYKPDIIVVGFSYHNISTFRDDFFLDKKRSSAMFQRSLNLIDINELSDVFDVNLFSYYKTLIMQKGLYPNKHVDYFGSGFEIDRTCNTTNADRVIKKHFYDKNKEYQISRVSINYLDSIVSLCKKNKIELVLVNTPVHINYFKKIPLTIKNEYNELKKNYRQINIKIFEDTINKYPDTLFKNVDHLNLYGSEVFTKELSGFLKKTKSN